MRDSSLEKHPMKAKHPKTKLVKLIIVRHGEYGSDGRLTEFGREQINRLAKLIAKRIKRHTKKIMVASPAKRTLETADILKLKSLPLQHRDSVGPSLRYPAF